MSYKILSCTSFILRRIKFKKKTFKW
jgi:hypothetical protein